MELYNINEVYKTYSNEKDVSANKFSIKTRTYYSFSRFY